MGERRTSRSLAQGFALATGLGTGFAAAVALGVWGGLAIDRALGWRPLAFTVGLGLLGGAAALRMVVATLAGLDRAGRRGAPSDAGSQQGAAGRGRARERPPDVG